MDESTQQTNILQKVSFSFDHHKQSLKHTSVELYQALKTIEWRAKASPLATDQGLRELTEANKEHRSGKCATGVCVSLLVACVAFSTVCAILYLAQAESLGVRLTLALLAFMVGLVGGLTYFFYVLKCNRLEAAVKQLAEAFQKDIEVLLSLPTDLASLNKQARLLILVDAVSMLRNMLVRTFPVRRRREVDEHMRNLYASLDTLVARLQLNIPELIKESRKSLSKFEVLNSSSADLQSRESGATETQQLQHVDMLFRFYLPLYSLLAFVGQRTEISAAIKKMLMDE